MNNRTSKIANTIPKDLQDALHEIASDQEFRIKTLKEWCALNTGSHNIAGLNKMRELLVTAFKPLADNITVLNFPDITKVDIFGKTQVQEVAAGLLISKRLTCKRRVLLVGHMDTVYNECRLGFDQTTTTEGERVYNKECRLGLGPTNTTENQIAQNMLKAPGAADMKGGLLVILSALRAFEKCHTAHNIGWDLFINTDEEIGSLASSASLIEHGKRALVALVFEPALNTMGDLAKARPGSAHFTVVAHGIKAHAGRDFDKGRNAILLLSRALLAIKALETNHPGLTINPGFIQGGEALNQVPSIAGAKIEIRIRNKKDETYIQEALKNISKNLSTDGLYLEITGHFHRPLKIISPATEMLFKRTKKLAKYLNIDLKWQDTGGCCDGNQLANYLPVLDTLGVIGGEIHTSNEYICLDSLTERSQLATLLLHDLAVNF